MSDDASSTPAPPPVPSSLPDEQAVRIDQLLTAGLDDYFAGRYERAVQVWSRVFFLDRSNARARAYIERARSAVAERQRVAEAATAATDADPRREWRGEGASAEGRAGDERAGVLVVNGALAARLAPPTEAPVQVPAPLPATSAATRRARIAHGVLVAAAGILLFVAGYTVAARDRLAEWVIGVSSRRAPIPAEVRASVLALDEARQALSARRYDDARRALARIPHGDPLRPDADRLLAQLQRAYPIISPMLAPDVPASGAGSP
jgi:hypothetical protein